MRLLFGGMMGSSLVTSGLLLILFGIAILAAPELLAYIVAAVLVTAGMSILIAGLNMRRTHKNVRRMFVDMK